MKKVYIDFEFNKVSEPNYNLVCSSLEVDGKLEEYWLHKSPEGKKRLRKRLESLRADGACLVAYMAVAEARSLMALGLDPLSFKWIDEQIEWKMLTNHNHKLAYGKQLLNGHIVTTTPPKPKWMQTEEERQEANSAKVSTSLASCTYKLLGIKIDTDHKNEMRDLIISTPEDFTPRQRKDIQAYCSSDVKNMAAIYEKILEHNDKLVPNKHKPTFFKEMLLRGEYSARTAIMESTGYPINVEATRNFCDAVPSILKELQEDINSQFPDLPPFKWNKPANRYSMNLQNIQTWIKKSKLQKWRLTDSGRLSVSLDAFEERFHYRHDYPRNNYGAQMLRYFKFNQSLNGFRPKGKNSKNKDTFFDYVGSDGRCRPYMNIYGAQSSRSQPKATGFIPLKSSWVRSLIQPRKGRVCIGIDYGSQEFLLSGIESSDIDMIEAYKSGDVYLYFGKKIGQIPWNATKESHKKEREPFKSTTLGINYLMTKVGLAAKLTQDTGKVYTEDDAQLLINEYNSLYRSNSEWNELFYSDYIENGYVRLPCGWYLWGDNDNKRSVNNSKIQGTAASILRKAVALAQDAGLEVIYTLHDAVYIECDLKDALKKTDLLYDCMVEAFQFYFKGKKKEWAGLIRLDGDIWGSGLKEGKFKTAKGRILKAQKIYIDERGEKEYQKFSKYFTK